MLFEVHVEDFFHALTPPERWEAYEPRVVENTCRLLVALARFEVTATFFLLGHVAETHPQLVGDIAGHGHRLGSHGYWHRHGEREGDESDHRTRAAVMNVAGFTPVAGYRSPFFDTTRRPGYSGGAFFRILPYKVFRWNLRRAGTFWLHPHDLDPAQPRIPGAPPWRYLGLEKAEHRLYNLLSEVPFDEPR